MWLKIFFSSTTSALDVQNYVDAAVEKRNKKVFGPPLGKKLLIFIDNLNMPQADEYGTQQPLALLKFILDKNGLFVREKQFIWKYLKDVCKLTLNILNN